MLEPKNLLWVKNVKRDNGNAWAYMEYNIGDVFDLHFPNNDLWYPTNYERPDIGDCILIFQTVNSPSAIIDGTYITHIVTPTTNYVEVNIDEQRKYKRKVCVIAKSEEGVFKPDQWSFYKANRGQICSLETLELNGSNPGLVVTQNFFWNLFENLNVRQDEETFSSESVDTLDEDLLEVVEGNERLMLKLHKVVERNHKVIKQKKEIAIRNGTLFCEVCGFNFGNIYDSLGVGFIECHHKIPISKGGIVKTTIHDLALVCSNCHRMLHRKNKLGVYYSLDELKEIVRHNTLINHIQNGIK
jgi:hypothetical protein